MADPTTLGSLLLHLVTAAYLLEQGSNLMFAPPQGPNSGFKLPEYLTPSPTGLWAKLPALPLRDVVTLASAGAHAHTMEMQLHNALKPGSIPPLVDQWIAAVLIAGIAQTLRFWMRRRQAAELSQAPTPAAATTVDKGAVAASTRSGTEPSTPDPEPQSEMVDADMPSPRARILPPRTASASRMATSAAPATGAMVEAGLFRLGGLLRAGQTNKAPTGADL